MPEPFAGKNIKKEIAYTGESLLALVSDQTKGECHLQRGVTALSPPSGYESVSSLPAIRG